MLKWMILIVCIGTIAAGWLMYWKHPVIKTAEKKKTESGRVSVIIPARNEEKNLPVLFQSIKKQTLRPYEIIVADDGSSDRTADIAQQFGATVIPVKKESDWKGKTAGCWQGAEAADGDWLLFMDADAFFAGSDALERIIGTYESHGAKGMLSVQPYHAIQKGYENFSVLFNILVMSGMNVFSVIGHRFKKSGGFGPFFLSSKEDYLQTGGHKAAKDSLIEGFALAEAFHKNALPVHLYGGKDSVHFRMYPEGMSQLINGWTKHFATGAQQTHPLVMMWIALWIAGGFIVPSLLLIVLLQPYIGWMLTGISTYSAYALQFYLFAQRTGNFRWWIALFFPAAFLFFVRVFMRSWIATNILKSVTWKGQQIDL